MNPKCKFIKATEEFNTFEKFVSAPLIRKSFLCENAVLGKIKIAACGFYKLYLNGEDITKGFFAPYISNPDEMVYYDEYEVSLQKGENVIGIVLGNGFQNNPGGYMWEFDKSPFRSAPSVALELELNNGEIILQSDSSFKTFPSPIVSDDYRFGEIYDANLEIIGWNKNGFDDTDWDYAIETAQPKGELRLCSADPILAEKEIKPKSITAIDDGYIYDFGECNAGVCRLKINGKKGQQIVLRYADILDDQDLNIANVWFVTDSWERDKNIVHKDAYICHGKETEYYTPSFTYHGFRYVKVSGITPDQATDDLLTYIVLHSDLKIRGGFSSSDDILNKIQEITVRSDLANFHYFPTDCPQREKNGWTGDAALSCEQILLNLNAEKSLKEWLRNICKAQKENGAIPGIVPTGGWGIKWGNGPCWDRVLVEIPYYVYMYCGDTEIITEAADAIEKYLGFLASINDERGLTAFGLGDWIHISNKYPKSPGWVTSSLAAYNISRKAEFLFNVVGMKDRAAHAKNIADDYRKAIREHLIDFDTTTAMGNCQTSQALCLYYGIFDKNEEENAFNKLLQFIHNAEDHFDTGVMGCKAVIDVLSSFGYSELAYKMITQKDKASYAFIVNQGATTLWECLEEYGQLRKFSFNHHFWGFVSAYFIKSVAGIHYNPYANDISYVDICPSFITELDHAKSYYDSPKGKISVCWERNEENIILTVDVPNGMSGYIKLENGFLFEDHTSEKEVVSGKFKITTK